MKDNTVAVLIGIIVIVCSGIGVYGWIAIHNIDTTQFLLIFGTIAAPNLALLFNILRTSQIHETTKTMENRIDTIENSIVDDSGKETTPHAN